MKTNFAVSQKFFSLFLAAFVLLLSGYGCTAAENMETSLTEASGGLEESSSRAAAENTGASSVVPPAANDGSSWYSDPNRLPSVAIKDAISGEPITEETEESFLEIAYTLPAYSVEKISFYTATFLTRGNALALGLSRFCPTISYVFSNGGKYDSFLDVFVREKDGPVGENYAAYSCFVAPCGLTWQSEGAIAEETVTVDSYHSKEDFFKKNFSDAVEGENSAFTRCSHPLYRERNGIEFMMYSYDGAVDPDAPETGVWDVPAVYERYGEHFIVETEKYLYIFALSATEEDETLKTAFRDIVKTVKLTPGGGAEPPIWAKKGWYIYEPENVRFDRDELSGTIPECMKAYLKTE